MHPRQCQPVRRGIPLLPAVVIPVAALVVACVGTPASMAAPPDAVPIDQTCPALYALGVQGAEESGPNPGSSHDSGSLGQMFGPLVAATEGLAQRAYVPYGSSRDGAQLPYDAAITAASQRLEDMAVDIVNRCPTTQIAAVGYAHGAPAVSRFAERVGAGTASVPADQVASIALLANPERAARAPILPGSPHATSPIPAPGTAGDNVAAIEFNDAPRSGAGINARPETPGYGPLSGRVAELCVAGDAVCDVPAGSPLATTAANIADRADLRDPIAAITTIASALSATVYTTAVEVVNEDVTGTSLDQVSYQPDTPLGQRLADASDPATTPPGPEQALSALFKLGTIGLNAVVSVAQTVFTPATVAELAAVGMANPWAAVATLGTKLAEAVVELIPPQTASRWINEAFTAITSTITDQRELYTLAGTARYSTATSRDGSYTSTPATPDGRSTLTAAADWLTAVARDLDAARPSSPAPKSLTASTSSTTTAPQPPGSGDP